MYLSCPFSSSLDLGQRSSSIVLAFSSIFLGN
uniref:Uncharacterized protein n=1 Tax=Arundo donax TaxID=35708 RepID=A0A0A8Z990_ARUDO